MSPDISFDYGNRSDLSCDPSGVSIDCYDADTHYPYAILGEKTVYRLQRNGGGPYWHGDLFTEASTTHPMLWDDGAGIDHRPEGWLFGFESMDSFHRWFSADMLNQLPPMQYELTTYITKAYIPALNQLVFVPKRWVSSYFL